MTHFLKSPSQRSMFFMFLSLFFFTANVLLIRGLAIKVPEANGWVATIFRGVVGIALLLTLYGGSRGLKLRLIFTHPKLLARGMVGGLSILIFYVTIVHLGAGRALVINLSYPLFGVVIAAVWLKEPLSARAILWLLAGLGGLALFFADSAFDGSLGRYELLALGGAATAGVAVALIRGLSKDHHPSTIYASQCIFGALLTIPVAGQAALALPPRAWLILSLGAALVAFGQLSITVGFRHLSVAKGSSIQMLLPILTTAGAYLFLEETLSASEIAGALLTLLAIWKVLRIPTPTTEPIPSLPTTTFNSKI